MFVDCLSGLTRSPILGYLFISKYILYPTSFIVGSRNLDEGYICLRFLSVLTFQSPPTYVYQSQHTWLPYPMPYQSISSFAYTLHKRLYFIISKTFVYHFIRQFYSIHLLLVQVLYPYRCYVI